MSFSLDSVLEIVAIAVPVALAIILHEVAHGWAAYRLGDDTARRMGRLTLNPLKHIDPVGTVILPLILYVTTHFTFGWAKPVPVDFGRLRHPRRDMAWVALAGPATNLILALVSAFAIVEFLLRGGNPDGLVATALSVSIDINLVLMIFNLIPLPPLDGGRVAVGLLPLVLARPLARLERVGMAFLVGVLFIVPLIGSQLGYDANILGWVIGPLVEAAKSAILGLAIQL